VLKRESPGFSHGECQRKPEQHHPRPSRGGREAGVSGSAQAMVEVLEKAGLNIPAAAKRILGTRRYTGSRLEAS